MGRETDGRKNLEEASIDLGSAMRVREGSRLDGVLEAAWVTSELWYNCK